MRIAAFEEATGREAVVLGLIRRVCGFVPDAFRVMLHRPDDFGRPYARLLQEAMRGPSIWSPAERELLASYVSSVNGCDYCSVSHMELACRAGIGREADLIRREGTDAARDPRLRAAFAFLAAFAIGGGALRRQHVEALVGAGVSDEAIWDLVHLGFVFCVGNRIADALGFEVPTPAEVSRVWPLIRLRGYRI